MKYPNPITGELNELDLENPQPGIYAGVSQEDYLKTNAISRSSIKAFRDAPEYFLKPPIKMTDALIFGTQYHAYVFEPEAFKTRFVEGIVTAQGRRGKDFRMQQEQHGSEYVYKPDDLVKIEEMYEALMKYPKAHSILSNDNPKELMVVFFHEYSGLICKLKIDIIVMGAGWIIDLKTTKNARREKFRWSIRDYAYDLQAGFYVMGCQATPGLEKVANFAIVAQEKESPYMVRTFRMDEYIADGIVDSNSLLCELADWQAAGCILPDNIEQMSKYNLEGTAP